MIWKQCTGCNAIFDNDWDEGCPVRSTKCESAQIETIELSPLEIKEMRDTLYALDQGLLRVIVNHAI